MTEKRDAFSIERGAHAGRMNALAAAPGNPSYIQDVRDVRGWILFGPQDVRERRRQYFFALQKLDVDRDCRVRVGCRYFTLAQAWSHWSRKARHGWTSHKNEGKQALAIVKLMVLQAQAYGLLSHSVKFDSSIVKRRK